MTLDAPSRPADLVLLPNGAMRARRRPRAVLALWAWEATVAFCIGWPFAATVAGLYGSHPAGDAPLWAGGGLELMSLGMRAWVAGPGLEVHAAVGLVVASAAGIWCTAAMFLSLAYTTRDLRPPRVRQALAVALAVFGPSALVVVTLGLVQVLLVACGWALAQATNDALYFKVGEARAEQTEWVILGITLFCVLLVGVVQEVARAAIVRYRMRAGPAILFALGVARRAPVPLFWSWGWRALAGLVPLAFGALVAQRLGGRGGAALVALVAVHQAVVLARVALRSSWLAHAIRATDAASPPKPLA